MSEAYVVWELVARVLNEVLPWPRRHVVPDLSGMTKEEAHERLLRSEYVLARADGDGVVRSPEPVSRKQVQGVVACASGAGVTDTEVPIRDGWIFGTL